MGAAGGRRRKPPLERAGQRTKMVNIDFPQRASIPAVSIMNPEPTGPVLPGVAAAAAANPNGRQPQRRRGARDKPAATPPVPPPPQPVPAGSAAIEPIWPEPVPPPPAPQTAAAPAAARRFNSIRPCPAPARGAAVRDAMS